MQTYYYKQVLANQKWVPATHWLRNTDLGVPVKQNIMYS